jgi:hypothetical protein
VAPSAGAESTVKVVLGANWVAARYQWDTFNPSDSVSTGAIAHCYETGEPQIAAETFQLGETQAFYVIECQRIDEGDDEEVVSVIHMPRQNSN